MLSIRLSKGREQQHSSGRQEALGDEQTKLQHPTTTNTITITDPRLDLCAVTAVSLCHCPQTSSPTYTNDDAWMDTASHDFPWLPTLLHLCRVDTVQCSVPSGPQRIPPRVSPDDLRLTVLRGRPYPCHHQRRAPRHSGTSCERGRAPAFMAVRQRYPQTDKNVTNKNVSPSGCGRDCMGFLPTYTGRPSASPRAPPPTPPRLTLLPIFASQHGHDRPLRPLATAPASGVIKARRLCSPGRPSPPPSGGRVFSAAAGLPGAPQPGTVPSYTFTALRRPFRSFCFHPLTQADRPASNGTWSSGSRTGTLCHTFYPFPFYPHRTGLGQSLHGLTFFGGHQHLSTRTGPAIPPLPLTPCHPPKMALCSFSGPPIHRRELAQPSRHPRRLPTAVLMHTWAVTKKESSHVIHEDTSPVLYQKT
eukprot:TRINITY_DN4218_c0_g6_i2.p1 TRINITY_DN4218_c0_g6~~TRINITY_DN4218_c0_g6_i2.p1  ORF type:complete len:418 (+),score=-87.29 TRINITY_DN4218_c0_g6_i2:532-1785(+)